MKRRRFLRSTGTLAAASVLPQMEVLGWLGTKNKPLLLKDIGLQLFSVPLLMEKDFTQGIGMLAEMGFRKLELYGPYTFSASSAKERWKSLAPRLGFSGSGFYGHSVTDLKSIIDQHGMSIPALHTDLETLENHMEDLAKASETLNFDYVILPALPAENRKNMDDYKRTADLFNAIGRRASELGIKFAYHNHGYGLNETEGQIPLQYLIEHTEKDWVYFEMDLFWTTAGGADPLDYLSKYPGRYKLMHVKDMTEQRRFSGDGGDPSQWMELFPVMCSAGDGVLDLEAIIPAAIESGVKHFIVEQDMVKQPEIALQKSIDYLSSI
ncbi:MAG: sugar phosphate isomerase/epimerase family protein [Flavobacteriaceae bacterium]